MLPAILICAFMVKNVATQRTATATLGTTKPCVMIGDDVKMLCTVSADCCTTYPRVWKKVTGAVELLNNGGSSDKSKYVEDYDGVGTTGFNLIIKNVQKSDFGLNYSCSYGVTKSNILYLDDILCDCRKCAGKDYGWAFIGTVIVTVIGTVIMIIAKVKKVCLRVGELKTVLIVGGLTFIISAGFDYVALPICEKLLHCNDERCWWLFLLGLVISLIIGVITLICMQKQGCCKDLRPLLDDESLFSKCTGCYEDLRPLCGDESTVPTVKVQRSSYVVTTGETMTLVCTVTSRLTISSVQWERNVGGSTTTIDSNTNINKYSGSTATTPSLTILKAASSDEGTYRCFASNSVGTGQSTTIIVGSSQGSNGSSCWPSCKVEQEPKNLKKPSSNEQPLKENKKKKPAAEKSSNEPPLEKKKKKKSAAETGSRSPTAAAKHIKTANNETEMIPTEKGFSGDLEKKRPLPPLTTQLSPTNRPLPLPSSTKPLPSSTRPLPQITTKKGDN